MSERIQVVAGSTDVVYFTPRDRSGDLFDDEPTLTDGYPSFANESGTARTVATEPEWDATSKRWEIVLLASETAAYAGEVWTMTIDFSFTEDSTTQYVRDAGVAIVISAAATAAPTLVVGTNTYVDLDDAEDLVAGRLDSSAWYAATLDDRARALIAATRSIDRLFLRGEKYDYSQTLAFPRRYRLDEAPVQRDLYLNVSGDDRLDGVYTESSVPDAVIWATIEEAIEVLDVGSTSARERLQAQGVRSITIGKVSETYSGSGSRLRLRSAKATEYLRPYIAGAVSLS